MLYNSNFENGERAHGADSIAHWRAPASGNRLDCETGVLLRRKLAPIFKSATSWADLRSQLADASFALAFRAGRLMLTDINGQTYICSCKFLGWPLKDLSTRLGKPRARQQSQCGSGKIVG